ncbi:DUF2911 domain-containing protein [Ekhidna sp. To15]|uniref:DUF2911 domain-containing protein n=1 Tax=Ekhidna sp. To15 TaxID=3395267 RepID=UPI003F528680
MKKLLVLVIACMAFTGADAQEFPELDASPMDAAYFPPRAAFRAFAKTDEERKANEPKIRVVYSRPQKNDRDVFGGLVKYGEVWRLGANESTEIQFYQAVTIGDAKLVPGRYTVYAVPSESDWEVHISTDNDGWGHYAFKPEESTVAKIKVPTQKAPSTLEAFTIMFEASDDGAHMIMGWEDTMVRVPIKM